MSTLKELSTFGLNGNFVAALAQEGARFIIIGGLAVKFYCPDRVVDDLDILIDPTLGNAQAVRRVLLCFGLRPQFSVQDLAGPKKHLPLRNFLYLDLLTPDTETSFDDLLADAQPASLNGVVVHVASARTLLSMKEVGARDGREKDARDVVRLGHARER
jgi:hypothetical protein